MQIIQGDIYDYPKYYDLIFGSDWKAEYRFLTQAFDRYATGAVNRLFEPACGTGRLLYRLARNGYRAAGLDLNPLAVDYCNARFRRHSLAPTAHVGNMCDYRLARKVDASFNMINSFRHLDSEQAASDHLRCVAQSLRRGGLYVLGLHLTPTTVPPTEEEAWSARRGNLCVNTCMRTTDRDLRRRREQFAMTFDVHTPTKSFQIRDEIVFRTYTCSQFGSLLRKISQFELAAAHDFHYDIRNPIELDGDSEDVVFVLRRI